MQCQKVFSLKMELCWPTAGASILGGLTPALAGSTAQGIKRLCDRSPPTPRLHPGVLRGAKKGAQEGASSEGP